MSISVAPSPAVQAAQELVDKANAFAVAITGALTNGIAAEGSRPEVSGSDLSVALGSTAVSKLRAMAAAAD